MGGGESGPVSRRSRAFEPSGQCANSDRFDVNPQGGAVLPELINRPALTLSPEPENEMTREPEIGELGGVLAFGAGAAGFHLFASSKRTAA